MSTRDTPTASTAAAAVTGAIHDRQRSARRARLAGPNPGEAAGGSRSGRTSRSAAAWARVAART
jgi:hypothetical protein